MKMRSLLIILMIYTISFSYEIEIRQLLERGCSDGWLLYGTGYDIKEITDMYNSDSKICKTETEMEKVLLMIANEEYNSYESDSTHKKNLLFCILYFLVDYGKESDAFIKKMYKTGNSDFQLRTLDYMILKSDEWFQCSKNIIDSLNTDKYDYSFRIKFYYGLIKLLKEKQEKGAELDSIKYIMYHALINEHWGHVLKLENEYALMEPGYVKSKQRLEILKKIDNENIKENIKHRNEKRKEYPEYSAYEEDEIAYKAYLKLKKGIKKLNNYTPPALP